MELRALIVDDESDSRSVLSTLLKEFCSHVNVCGEAANIEQAYEMIIKQKPQVVFLDIQMPGGNGFALLKKFIEVPFEIIFVTSYDKYAIEAIKFSALDYLLKPVEVDQLVQSVAFLQNRYSKNQTSQSQIVNVINHVENKGIKKKIVLHHKDMVFFVPLDEINYLEGERNYTHIHTAKGENYTSSKNLGEYEELFKNYSQFFRISKSCIANLNYVSNYSKGEPCMLFISGEIGFEISRRKKQELIEKLKK